MTPLALALPAMTAVQATVALGLFSLATLAPAMGISIAQLGMLSTLMFTVGALMALSAGRLIARWGDWPLAALCAAAVAVGMLCLAVGGVQAVWPAVVLFGLAFGPETPASASALSRVTPARRRPLVFSIRQTGNQIGAIAGSLALPWLMALNSHLPFITLCVLAVAVAAWCGLLARQPGLRAVASLTGKLSEAGIETRPATGPAPRAGVRFTFPLRVLAASTLVFSAMQMCLNVFLLSHAVQVLQLPLERAAAWLALLQAGGLFGRLFWGWLAQRFTVAARLLGVIGLIAALAGAALVGGLAPADGMAFGVLMGLLGFSASGWNGVLVAELARIAGPQQAGALTGAVLTWGYAGLALAPITFAWLSGQGNSSTAFLGIFLAAGLAGAALLLTRPAPSA